MGADYQTLHQLDRSRRERWRDVAHRAFRDREDEDVPPGMCGNCEEQPAVAPVYCTDCWHVLDETINANANLAVVHNEARLRAERRVRELEKAQGELLDLLDHERGRNRALVMEIEAWRANDEGRAARLREACETTVREMERYYRNGSHPDLSPVLKASKDALAADREGR